MFNERNELGNLTLIKLVDIGKVRGAASFQSQSPLIIFSIFTD